LAGVKTKNYLEKRPVDMTENRDEESLYPPEYEEIDRVVAERPDGKGGVRLSLSLFCCGCICVCDCDCDYV
jgi:hypothetical protein